MKCDKCGSVLISEHTNYQEMFKPLGERAIEYRCTSCEYRWSNQDENGQNETEASSDSEGQDRREPDDGAPAHIGSGREQGQGQTSETVTGGVPESLRLKVNNTQG